ncbi:hypothetical protein XBKQ1_2680013 [Xenorhabdus bovienii str. kraussei Quebec]|uniref:Uncharacterized protein n=1 Tax=Xenorhabdus bovienii str. kraussei Quebec TaxID=1398203 RepID=A0A077PLD2_XENBV|nr:hypothetical protein XBKQ1_2680013 [Xenorhabdus bovienii str. kraussei Quebec]
MYNYAFRSQLILTWITDHSQQMILYSVMIFLWKNHLSTDDRDPNNRSNKEIFK